VKDAHRTRGKHDHASVKPSSNVSASHLDSATYERSRHRRRDASERQSECCRCSSPSVTQSRTADGE